MRRRGRAIAFASAAALCAGLAASTAGGARTDIVEQLGPLRDVLVATEALPAHRPINPAVGRRALELRRIPDRFVPPGALGAVEQAVGRAPAVAIPAGGFVLGPDLAVPGGAPEAGRPLPAGRRPVEISVEGAGPLAGASRAAGHTVDVVVTTEPGPAGGAGRTYVAAAAVALLDLRPAAGGASDDVLASPVTDSWLATLALTRGQALRLIHAQSFARDVRLIGS